MESEDALNSELNPASLQSDNNSNSGSQSDESFGKKFTGFLKNNKGKIAGFGGGGVIAAVLMMFGSMLSGPMQIVHAGQVIGEVIDTARDITSGLRLSRNVYKVASGKSYVSLKQSSRLSAFMRVPTTNFVSKLSKEAGIEVVSDGMFGFARQINITGNAALSEFAEQLAKEGFSNTTYMRKLLAKSVDDMPGNKIYKFIMKRNLNKMYRTRWYDGVARYVSGQFSNLIKAGGRAASSAIKRLETWVANQQVKNGQKLAQKGIKFGDELVDLGTRSLREIGEGASSKFGLKFLSSVGGKAVKFLPVIGWLLGFAFDFFLSEYLDAEKVEELLVSSMIKAGEIATAADDIKNGTVPEEDDEGNYVPAQTYMESIAMQSIYREYDTPSDRELASIMNSAYAVSDNCSDISADQFEEEEDYKKALQECFDSSEVEIADLSKSATVGSSFFSNTPLQAEFDSNFAISESDSEYYRGVPKLVAKYVGKDTMGANLINALIASVTIIGPKDIEEFLEGEYNVEELIPSEVGGASMYGARVQQNDLSISEGAKTLSKEEEASLLRESQTYLAEKQMEKSWFARMFDVEDYHSGVATLSRDAEWDLSDSSFTTQFANVIRTFAALPKLISKSLGTYTRAASASSPTPYNYGFNMVAYTTDQVDREPDYWDAEEYLLDEENFERIDEGKLAECTGAVISQDDLGIKVTWSEEATVSKMNLSDGHCNDGYFEAYEDEHEKKYFISHDSYDNEIEVDGETAVRVILANYKTLAAFAATSFDELEDNGELEGALSEVGLSQDETQSLLVDSLKDIGVEYGASGSDGSGGGGGDGEIVAIASDASGLDCGDCVRFVNSVYASAGKPRPLRGFGSCPTTQGATNIIYGYTFCGGFVATSSPAPGDIVVWSGQHVGIWMGNGLISEGGGRCRINTTMDWARRTYGGQESGYVTYVGSE